MSTFRTAFHRLRSQRLAACVALVALGSALLTACADAPKRASPSRSTAVSSPWAAPTSTVLWNEYACELIARNQVGQFPALRTLTYLNLAINNAIVTAQAKGVKPEGAAAGAAAAMLVFLYPKDEQAITRRLETETASLGANGYRPDFTVGVEIGRTAAADVVAMAKSDRSGVAWTGTLPTGSDKWSSRAQPPAPPLGPHFGSIRTFFMVNGAEFRAPPPPDLSSPAFKAQLTEVRTVSDGRTYEQLRIAQYWENLSGAFAAGVWNEVARQAVSERGLGEAESARVFALMHLATFDALVACHDSKYVYWVPRPTQLDSGIRLAIGVPNHPSYPSNHACLSGAAGLVLDSQFPDAKGRYFAMGQQAGESRIYAGIHYRIDLDEGFVIARKVSARALEVGVPTDRPFTPRGQ
jgi:PAP2 superfamily